METYNQTAFPRVLNSEDDPFLLNNAHESYDVFVNNKFVGKKILSPQSDRIDYLTDFIKAQGIEDLSTHLDGDHFFIRSKDSKHVTTIVESYLQNK
ncbi:hypothetical protein [Halalkalibacter hemicellulosilyticus]|uniref:Uncharacterized protein n=1 Tax=Halalkalibacter hemicellulosilyticusJCM 9152 TaxID=1236971 RepID=W4QC58_9BACI|nr:hypothetical protein [Halalkalibacter hemicellulosilyticus]GAE29532.1 hypothetical protein JCM9152_895 [Halalkalibacter hemicellulosilyticusJCM 9152]